jgi:predicted secreted protein
MSSSRTVRRIAATTIGIVIASTTAASATSASTGPVFHHRDSGRTVHLKVGTVFTLKLKGCPTCGYDWNWKHHPNHHIVKQIDKPAHWVSHLKPGETGGFATKVYRFKVVGAGTTRLVLVEKSPAGKVSSHFRLTQARKTTS